MPGKARLIAAISIWPAIEVEDNGVAWTCGGNEKLEISGGAVRLPFANRPQAFEWRVRSPQFGDKGGIRPTTARVDNRGIRPGALRARR